MPAPVLAARIDGREPDAAALLPFAVVNDGHFTAMQVRDAAARGLALHMDRLAAAHARLYGTALEVDHVRLLMRVAVADHPDASLKVTVAEPIPGQPCVLTVVRAPAEPDRHLAVLLPAVSTRALAEIKHAGTFHQIQLARDANAQGFDDALLVDASGRIAESTAANIAFVTGKEVVWPTGPMLEGITWQLLEPALDAHGFVSRRDEVTLADISRFTGAVLVNSVGISPIARIGDVEFGASVEAAAALGRVYRQIPFDPV